MNAITWAQTTVKKGERLLVLRPSQFHVSLLAFVDHYFILHFYFLLLVESISKRKRKKPQKTETKYLRTKGLVQILLT